MQRFKDMPTGFSETESLWERNTLRQRYKEKAELELF